MEKEVFFSGYCRTVDQSRMMAVVTEDGRLTEVDCCYENCVHAPNCTVAEKIRELIKPEEGPCHPAGTFCTAEDQIGIYRAVTRHLAPLIYEGGGLSEAKAGGSNTLKNELPQSNCPISAI